METLQRLHNRGSVSTGFDIDNSLKLEADNSEYLSRTPSSNSNRQTFTYSTWVKRTENNQTAALLEAYQDGTNFFLLQFSGSKGRITAYNIDSGTDYGYGYTPAHRDTSAWYHIVFVSDTTNSTASDRYQLYVNGVRVTDINTDYGTPPQNYNNNLNSTITHNIGRRQDGNTYMSAYLAETHLVDGTALAPTTFGEFDEDSGIWKPKQVTGVTYGTNGFYLDYSTASDLGADKVAGGNSNDFTENNITAADQATDTPTNNFATINTLQSNNSKLIISNGATSLIKSGNHGWQTTSANMAVRKGKWYAEFKLDTNASLIMLGVNQIEDEVAWNGSHIGAYSNSTARGMAYYSQTGYFYRNGGSGAIASTYAAGDIIGIALLINDNLTGFMGMHKNGTWQNSQDPSSGTSGMLGLEYGNAIADGIHYTFAISNHEGTGKVLANFGGFDGFTVSSGNADANGYGNFEYAPPTGYYALCTKNLEEFA